MPIRPGFFVLLALVGAALPAWAGDDSGAKEFDHRIQPLLQKYCADCHEGGVKKGNVAFDEFKSSQAAVADRVLWEKALKYVRADLMPPAKKPQPDAAERAEILRWIKRSVFQCDPQNPDPGRITLRRLNGVEYKNTIRDLTGVDFDTQTAFPPDDTGYGFDTIGDVLTLSPMLFEKYLVSAKKIVGEAMQPKKRRRFFHGEIPGDPAARRLYVREALAGFARQAFRRPVDEKTVNRLAALAESIQTRPGKTWEDGAAQGMIAVLSSPRFLFLNEGTETPPRKNAYPNIDEYSLASRLSYFLWSSMPDDELFRLAGQGRLRTNLATQVQRMLKDPRSENFVRDFTGQWLRGRDIESIDIDDHAVLNRERSLDPELSRLRERFRHLRDQPEETLTAADKAEKASLHLQLTKTHTQRPMVELSYEVRHAMRRETENVFGYVLHENRSLLELLDSDYTFLNQDLARYYGVSNVTGSEMRRVVLPPDSPRGGILTEGTVLVATSNPSRTSPVKRGSFILDSVLGVPTPPPPPNLPPLEDAARSLGHGPHSLRDTLAAHRQNLLCSSCHNRMDPLGLALENFNAMGLWRGAELGVEIDATGTLITGESFQNPRELKQVLAQKHAADFYRTLTEKMLIYALGRGLEYYDVITVDDIVARIEKSDGRASALLAGIVESAPFEKMRKTEHEF